MSEKRRGSSIKQRSASGTTKKMSKLDIIQDDNQIFIDDTELLQPLTPEVVAPGAQISFAPAPEFLRKDVLTEQLTSIKGELFDIENLQTFIDRATQFIPFLYSYRSISKAINNDDIPESQQIIKNTMAQKLDTAQVYEIFGRIFEKQFEQISELRSFCTEATNTIEQTIAKIEYEPSGVFFSHLTQLFDVLFNIENLKLVKTGIVNDLTFFKRKASQDAANNDVKDKGALERAQNTMNTANMVQVWLSTKNSILQDLHKKAEGNKKMMSIFTKYLEFCDNSYNNEYLLPKQRSSLIIGIVSALYICGSKKSSTNIFEQSPAQKVLKIIEKNSIIPLYAENSFAPGYVLAEADGFSSKGNNIATTSETLKSHESEYLVKNKMDTFREMYRKSLQITASLNRGLAFTEEDLTLLLSNVAEMSYAITLQFAFKMVIRKQVENSNNYKNYDRGVRLNYTPSDLNALIELIGYIKTLSSTAILAEERIVRFVSNEANHFIQSFIVNDLEKILLSCDSNKDSECIKILNNVRNAFGYWHGENPEKNIGKKSKNVEEHDVIDTIASISNHFIDVLRVQIHSIISPTSIFFKKKTKLSSKEVKQISAFINETKKYSYLVNFCPALRDATNLGALWYREVFLDLDQIIQFPVRSSLPFILAEHLLKISDRPALHDSMMFPFEIYNDAAFLALNTFKSQYLYKEIEAEVSLCIDMIAFSFSETFYRFSRETAAAIELPYDCAGKIIPTPMRYNIIVLQNKLMLLGSQVDFNEVTTEKLNRKLRTEIESYIELLSDVRMAPFVAHLVRVAKTTHSVLMENHLLMEPFSTIWQRAIAFTQPLSLESHQVVLLTKALDFVHYRFNSASRRFIDAKEITLTPPTNEKWASIYKNIHEIDTTYIGTMHFRAIVELLSQGEMSCFIQKITLLLEEELARFVHHYTVVATVVRMLPSTNRDELLGYYSFNSDAYHALMHSSLGALFNSMRIIGNIISFVWCLELEINRASSIESKGTVMTPILDLMKQVLLKSHELFIQSSEIDLESNTTHRSFAALWSILEFLMCSPKGIKLGDSSAPVQPLSTFGDGPIICANLFIELFNQTPFSLFDSINYRSAELQNAEKSKITQKELNEYLKLAEYAQQATTFARLVASPYKIEPTVDA